MATAEPLNLAAFLVHCDDSWAEERSVLQRADIGGDCCVRLSDEDHPTETTRFSECSRSRKIRLRHEREHQLPDSDVERDLGCALLFGEQRHRRCRSGRRGCGDCSLSGGRIEDRISSLDDGRIRGRIAFVARNGG